MGLARLSMLVLASQLAACSASFLGLPTAQVVGYEPQSVEVEAKQSIVFRAMREYIVANNLEIAYEDANLGRLEAVSRVESSMGMTTREHWILQFEPGRLTLEWQLQERVRGQWRSPDRVSERYSYARERFALRDIREQLIHAEMRVMSER